MKQKKKITDILNEYKNNENIINKPEGILSLKYDNNF